jgi:predicted RND superfamily exporter protein
MIYLKSILAGVAAAVGSLLITIPATLTIADRILMSRLGPVDTTHGGALTGDININPLPILLVALLAFVAGFYGMFRRGSRAGRLP